MVNSEAIFETTILGIIIKRHRPLHLCLNHHQESFLHRPWCQCLVLLWWHLLPVLPSRTIQVKRRIRRIGQRGPGFFVIWFWQKTSNSPLSRCKSREEREKGEVAELLANSFNPKRHQKPRRFLGLNELVSSSATSPFSLSSRDLQRLRGELDVFFQNHTSQRTPLCPILLLLLLTCTNSCLFFMMLSSKQTCAPLTQEQFVAQQQLSADASCSSSGHRFSSSHSHDSRSEWRSRRWASCPCKNFLS